MIVPSDSIPWLHHCKEHWSVLDGRQCPKCGEQLTFAQAILPGGRRIADLPEHERMYLADLYLRDGLENDAPPVASSRVLPEGIEEE